MSSYRKSSKTALISAWLMSQIIILVLLSNVAWAQNDIATENSLAGNPRSEWDINGAGDTTIQGFATSMSTNRGDTVYFKIKTDADAYAIDIYRLGYYNGLGARKVGQGTVTAVLPQLQPAPLRNTTTGLVDCGNWSQSGYWKVPENAVSGVYIARLVRATGGASHILFVVRNDLSISDIVFQTSDATWQAYNNYGGYSFYEGTTAFPLGRAVKVSYNRPLLTRADDAADAFFNAEYPMLRWLERNGYDISYISGADADRVAGLITRHKVFVACGNDEYWSANQRNNVTAARNAGTHLALFTGNSIYWKSRWENSVDGLNTPYRTLVCYKEGSQGAAGCGNKCDPLTTVWTGLWRDGCAFPAADGCKPEQALSGQFGFSDGTTSMDVPGSLKTLRFWRNTSITSLGNSQTANLTPGTVGYQYDYDQTSTAYPLNRVRLSKTTIGSRVHNMTFYKHTNGALVFCAGTMQYSWGLDSVHDRANSPSDPRLQQATVNLLADMNVSASSLQSGLVQTVASTDVTAPVSTITSLVPTSVVVQGTAITVRGTSTDVGGVVAGVIVSFDGGLTWRAATGTTSWTISWTPAITGAVTAMVRGVDDSGNMEGSSAGNNVIVQVATSGPNIEGPGGPILVVGKTGSGFNRFTKEILLAQGYNEFNALDISQLTTPILNNYDVVVMEQMSLTSAQVSMLTSWTNAGGTLIAFRPDAALAPLMGITMNGDSLSNAYLLVKTGSAPGNGIVGQTMQYHGSADLYQLNGATEVATLYSNAVTALTNPAVTSNNVGSNGGQAIAFAYDLPRSVVYTRQGNPAWAGQERDGNAPIRSNDLFTGDATTPDWIDFDKIQIPQADEQIHLLSNIILLSTLDRKPIPRFWFLPKGLKAAIVMTGDDHAIGGTVGRFNQYTSLSTSNTTTAVADWDAIRGTSYIYSNTPITNAQVVAFQNQGFDIALHMSTSCADYTASSLADDFDNQLAAAAVNYPGMKKPSSNRTHCIPWSDWSTQAEIQAARGIRLDVNYYYWPASWVQNRSGFFTGSGFPMRFAKTDGQQIDCYQVPTQLSDESNLDYTNFTNELLDRATGPEGYYGVFATNMHTDFANSAGSDAIIGSAKQHGIPVISAAQMLAWLDGRNSSTFSGITWSNNQLAFTITAGTGARNMETMVPMNVGLTRLSTVSVGGSNVPFRLEMIKGIQYGFFRVQTGNYLVSYSTVPPCTPPVAVISSPAVVCPGQPIPLTFVSSTGQSPFAITVNGTNYYNVVAGQVFATTTFNESSIWPSTSTPAIPAITDNIPIETGVRFQTSTNGQILGIRFYKGTGNTGTHTGALYTATGTLLASATFASETASGWQTVRFATPVNVTANTTYVASNYSPTGYYAYTGGYFSSSFTSGPLTALQSGPAGPNGVYKYGGGFPDGGNGANYWVDVLFKPSTSSATNQYVLTNVIDNFGCSNLGTISTTSSTIATLPSGTIAVSEVPCKNQPVMLTFNATAGTGPYTIKVNNTTYNNVSSGVPFNSGVPASPVQYSLWSSTTPVGANSNDAAQVELGIKIRSTVPGTIRSIRFYKYSNNTGVHTGSLWSATGTRLATATFVNETASGWQQVNFSTPVPILANTTYVASYNTPTGNYAFTSPGFNTAFANGPLSALTSGNGVYLYGSGFPNQTFKSTNYWVDVVFESNGAQTFNLSSIADVNSCTVTANFGSVSVTPTDCAPAAPNPNRMVAREEEKINGYALGQNYPNPFNKSTVFEYAVPQAGLVNIGLYDANGRLIRVLVRSWKPVGKHTVVVQTERMASGIYFYRMEAGSFHQVRKMTVQ